MIYLLTGLPGNGKTLLLLHWISQLAKDDNREVFYSGIPLTEKGARELGWKEVDPLKWAQCPPKSIVVVDEAQRVFRNRSIQSVPPKYVSDLETHRHLGIDLVFVTQMPKLIDPGVRALVQEHRHVVRIMGMQATTVHRWTEVRDDCHKGARRKDSEKSKWVFDKRYYDYYRSAEAHTMKVSIPKRVWVLAVVPFVLLAAVLVVKRFIDARTSSKPAAVSALPVASAGAAAFASSDSKPFDPVADARQYVWRETSRVKGLQYTSPKYDELTKPSRVPMPAACVQSADRCKCYSQQGTAMDIAVDVCHEIVRNGYFESFERDGRPDRSETVSSSRSSPSVVEAPQSDDRRVVVLDAAGYGLLGHRPDTASHSGGRT